MKTRAKTLVATIASRDEAELALNELARSENHKRNLIARLDAAVIKMHEAAAPAITACDAEIEHKCDALRAWARANPTEFAHGRKSIPFLSGTLGFRTGTPRLALCSRDFTWDRVVDLLRNKGWTSFIRTKAEADKERLVAQRNDFNLREVGLKVVQDECFFVEPRLAGAEQVRH